MKPHCPHCLSSEASSGGRIKKAGRYKRTSDSRWIQRFICLWCRRSFIKDHPARRQKKRLINHRLKMLLVSGVSQRRAAFLLHISRTTVKRKLIFLGEQALAQLKRTNLEKPKADIVIFDELETFEHTKCKPLSVHLAVDPHRRILGFQVSKMPAKGKLAKIALKKYGPRKDERRHGRKLLFEDLKLLAQPDALFKSDENPFYPAAVREHFPKAKHERHKGQRGSIIGQGELKKIRFDPLFSLNHSCAMLRANLNRLFRRTWCTTKLPERLTYHLAIYAVFHNLVLLKSR